MTDDLAFQIRRRARRALELSLRLAAPAPDATTDPELLDRLDAALRSLPRKRREIFLAVRLDGTSYGEIAQRTGHSVRKVEREVASALTQIDRWLEQSEGPPRRSWWRRVWRR